MYTIQQILSLSTSISKIAQPHNDLINFSNSLVKKEFEIWSDRLLNLNKENLSDSIDEIVFILNRLPNFESMLLSRQIEESHPGLSVYFIMQGLENYEHDNYKFFIDRLCTFKDNSLLLNIYTLPRARLIGELLKNIKPSPPAKLFKVSDEEIVLILKEMMQDWEENGSFLPEFEDEVKSLAPELNGRKIYLRRALK